MRMRCLAFLASVGIVAGAAGTGAQAASEMVFGITSNTAFSLPHYIAEEEKYYVAEGLSVDTIVVGAAAGVLQQLAGGSLNMAQAATDQTLRAIPRGAPIRIVAGASSNAPFRVCAVTRRRFPVGASPTRRTLQPEAAGAAMEVTK